jgi:hypothetical protein
LLNIIDMKIVYWDQKYKEWVNIFSPDVNCINIHDHEMDLNKHYYKGYVEIFRWVE